MTNRVYTPEEIDAHLKSAKAQADRVLLSTSPLTLIAIIEQLRRERDEVVAINDDNIHRLGEHSHLAWERGKEIEKLCAAAKAKREKIAAMEKCSPESDAMCSDKNGCWIRDFDVLAILDEETP